MPVGGELLGRDIKEMVARFQRRGHVDLGQPDVGYYPLSMHYRNHVEGASAPALTSPSVQPGFCLLG